jgi:hypothetical protein
MEERLRGSSSDGSIGLLDKGKAAVLLNITPWNHTWGESHFILISNLNAQWHRLDHRHRHRVIQASPTEISEPRTLNPEP